jgi:hypothetical protein
MSRSHILTLATEQRHPEIDVNLIYAGCSTGIIPNFDEIYDQYAAAFVELKTKLSVDEIDQELLRLQNEYGPEIFDVERGYVDSLSEHKQVYVMEALMYNQLFFSKGKVVYNAPLVGVW